MLDDIFAEEIKKLIVAYEERAIGRLDKIIKEDKFLVVSSQSLGNFYSLSYDSPHILNWDLKKTSKLRFRNRRQSDSQCC